MTYGVLSTKLEPLPSEANGFGKYEAHLLKKYLKRTKNDT